MSIQSVRHKRAMLVDVLIVTLLVIIAYMVAGSDDCPGKDIAELTDSQKAEVVSRWHGR